MKGQKKYGRNKNKSIKRRCCTHNMLEIALYLAQQDKDAHEIDVNVKKS